MSPTGLTLPSILLANELATKELLRRQPRPLDGVLRESVLSPARDERNQRDCSFVHKKRSLLGGMLMQGRQWLAVVAAVLFLFVQAWPLREPPAMALRREIWAERSHPE